MHGSTTAQTAPRRPLAREVLPPRELANRRRAIATPALLVIAAIAAVAPGVEHVLDATTEDPRRREVDAARLDELVRQLDAWPGAGRPATSPAPPQAEPHRLWQPASWWSSSARGAAPGSAVQQKRRGAQR